MKELASLPASIRNRIEEAQSLATQNRPNEAAAILAEVARGLMGSNPELCALVLAAQFGFRQISFDFEETVIHRTTEDRLILGFKVGDTTHRTSTTRSISKTHRFS